MISHKKTIIKSASHLKNIWMGKYLHSSSVDWTILTVCSQVSLESQSELCSSSSHSDQESWSHPSSSEVFTLPSCPTIRPLVCTKALNGLGAKYTSETFSRFKLWDFSVGVCFNWTRFKDIAFHYGIVFLKLYCTLPCVEMCYTNKRVSLSFLTCWWQGISLAFGATGPLCVMEPTQTSHGGLQSRWRSNDSPPHWKGAFWCIFIHTLHLCTTAPRHMGTHNPVCAELPDTSVWLRAWVKGR